MVVPADAADYSSFYASYTSMMDPVGRVVNERAENIRGTCQNPPAPGARAE
jgi:hypothetical protein